MFELILQADPIGVYGSLFTSLLTTIGIAIPLAIAVIKKLDKDGKNRAVDVLEQVSDVQQSLVKQSATIKEGMQVVYDMQPEKAKEIINKPLVKLSELNAEIDRQNANLDRLKAVVDKYGQ